MEGKRWRRRRRRRELYLPRLYSLYIRIMDSRYTFCISSHLISYTRLDTTVVIMTRRICDEYNTEH